MDGLNLLYVPTREQWRAWLAEHHATVTEVWLVGYKKHTGKPRVPYDEAVEEALCFGWIDSILRRLDGERFAQKYTPRRAKSHWTELNLRRAERLVAEGRMTPAGLEKLEAAVRRQEPRWETSDPLPPIFEEALRTNEAARQSFLRLGPSYRRDYVRWVTEAKREETRQRRLQLAVQKLERNEKPGLK
jgi:uncharacterized protein YdeI (YjbR/CyaY-like superfamily)